MAAVGYTLEHFYYGQFVRQGKPEGELRLLASSAGIKQDDANEIIRSALLPPLNGSPIGSWGIVRGKIAPFVFVQSHLTPNGGAMLHVLDHSHRLKRRLLTAMLVCAAITLVAGLVLTMFLHRAPRPAATPPAS